MKDIPLPALVEELRIFFVTAHIGDVEPTARVGDCFFKGYARRLHSAAPAGEVAATDGKEPLRPRHGCQ